MTEKKNPKKICTHHALKGTDKLGRFSAIFNMGDNICDLQFHHENMPI